MPVQWNEPNIDDAIDAGLRAAADALLDNTKPLVPKDQGDLVQSGRTGVDGDTAAVGFGSGSSEEYALIQHQRTKYSHDDGQAKFLSTATEAFPGEFEQIMGAEIRRAIGG